MLNNEKKSVTINIGEIYIANEPTIIYTLLGSCVAVCMFDSKKRIGGMNHIFLPGISSENKIAKGFRYGEDALNHLIRGLVDLGADKPRLIAKAFGGAHVIPAISEETGVGNRIADFVVDYLKKENIKLIAHDLGGVTARKVYFHSDTGAAFVRRLTKT